MRVLWALSLKSDGMSRCSALECTSRVILLPIWVATEAPRDAKDRVTEEDVEHEETAANIIFGGCACTNLSQVNLKQTAVPSPGYLGPATRDY